MYFFRKLKYVLLQTYTSLKDVLTNQLSLTIYKKNINFVPSAFHKELLDRIKKVNVKKIVIVVIIIFIKTK